MISLTEKQAKALAFIKGYMAEHDGLAPTCEEIAAGIGLASKANICRILEALVERGAIRRLPQRARAIEIVEPVAPEAQPLPATFPEKLARLSDANFRRVVDLVENERRRRLNTGAAA